MYNSKKMMKKGPGIEIGGHVFQTFFNKQDHYLSNILKKSWNRFIGPFAEKGYRVEILPYSPGHNSAWNPSELYKFRKYFLNIHRRYPSNGRLEETVEESLNTLKFLRPESEQICSISSSLDDFQDPIYTRVGDDLFFFNTTSNIAYFFIKRRIRLSHGILWIFNWPHNRMSQMMAGIMNGFMFILSHLLIHDEGLLLHGAAIQKHGQSVLFLGPSGAGKSTITRLSKPDICFSDDGTMIKKEGNRIYAYRSPFTQYNTKDDNLVMIKGEIRKIFLLAKGAHHRVLPIRKNELMHTILMHLIHFYKYLNDETARAGFHLVKEILDGHPAYKLEFAKKNIIWDNICQVNAKEAYNAG